MTKRRKVRQYRPEPKMKSSGAPAMDDSQDVDIDISDEPQHAGLSYSENPLESPNAPHTPMSTASVQKAEGISAAAKIDDAHKVVSEANRKQLEQGAEQIKSQTKVATNTEQLAKRMEALEKAIKGQTKVLVDKVVPAASGAPSEPTAANDPLAAPLRDKNKGLGKTILGAVGASIGMKTANLKQMGSAKGLLGLAANHYAGRPDSVVGSVLSALHEREESKDLEKAKQDDFHTGFTTGTDAGRKLLAQTKEQVAKENPNLKGKKLDKAVDAQARKATEKIYVQKQQQEDEIAKLNAKETTLKTKDKLFGLSDEETRRRQALLVERAKLVTTGGIVQQKPVTVAGRDDKEEIKLDSKRDARIGVLEDYHGRKLTDDEVAKIDAQILKENKEQLEQLKVIAGAVTKTPGAAAEMQAEDKQEGEKLLKKPEVSEPPKPGKFLGKGKDLLSKGKDAIAKGSEGMIAKLLGPMEGLVGILGKVAPMLGPIAAVAAAGAVGYLGAKALGADKLGSAIGTSDVLHKDVNAAGDVDNIKDILKDHPDMKLNDAQVRLAKKSGIDVPEERQSHQGAKTTAPVMEKVPRNNKPEIDERSAKVEEAKAQKPIVVNAPATTVPVVNNTTKNTTIMRTPLRNQEPSFNKTLQQNFV